MTTKDGLIVLSGGMDSVTLLYEYQDSLALAVSFDYGSKHNARELPYARLHCERLGIEHLTIPLSFIGQHFRSALLEGGGAIPKGSYDEENMAATVVPFRNGIMLSIAAGLAESRGLTKVYLANHFGDHAIYPDCRASFIRPMHEAILQGTSNAVEVTAPYTDISKGDIARHGKLLGINYAETWSCYEGGDLQCGSCATCIERREAMQEAGIEDPTHYKQ
ncbi:protein ExsB [Porphyromonas sp. oral taxon 278 str. W7784]|uniref:7-cyano-7-deazaguanine synthase QueC n=1 Tax=Porphyromonas sp. oral taxon 278 TaxID=712437 RepID=UPI0003ACE039|nr:7-cyano-7-deazaguanine synthase QueC [Porphyromonas sp. oral taxon 278]ERJ72407.1 protein ExsB [Porphyromonas sp. oral taxon 278 str. W7784]